MKKIGLFLIFIVSFILFTGCTSGNIEGSLEDIMAKVYIDIKEDEKPMYLTNTKITDENIEGFLGTKDIEYKEALASESMVGSIAHSVILVRAKDGADIQKLKETIKENIDPRKWICVGVSDDEVIIKNKGDLIIVIVVEDKEIRTKLEKGFDAL